MEIYIYIYIWERERERAQFCLCKHILFLFFFSRSEYMVKCVSILASFCVWTNSLMCKDVVNRDSTCQSIFRWLCTAKKIEDFRLFVSFPDDVSSRPDARQTSNIRPNDISFRPDPPLYRVASDSACIRRTSQQPVRTSIVIDQLQILSKFRYGKIDSPSGRCGFPSGRTHI